MSNLLFTCKYPPIEGGESSKAYWLTRALGERNHKVTILSTCQEVEENYKIKINANELKELQPKNVSLYSTNPFYYLNFIPKYNPLSEKLTSLGLEILRESEQNLILGWYLLPNAIAASNLSDISGAPFIFQHAGSDISNLLLNPATNIYLMHIIKKADLILSYPSTENFFKSITDAPIYIHRPKISPEFNPRGNKINLFEEFGLDENRETMLFLGKVSKKKGIGYLLDAFSKNCEDKNLLIIGCGDNLEKYKLSYSEKDHIYFLDSVPPWKVPSLLRSVNSVVVPETDFGIRMHRSRVPLEAICTNTPLLVSEEVNNNLKNRLSGCYTYSNTKEVNEFSKAIEEVMFNESLRRELIESCDERRHDLQKFKEYVDSIEEVLLEIIKEQQRGKKIS